MTKIPLGRRATMSSYQESTLVILFKLQIVIALSSFLTGQSTKVGYTSDQSQYYTAPVKNVIQCQRLCSYQPLCKTFNYNAKSRSCELTLGRDTQASAEVFVTSQPSTPPEVVSTKCTDIEVFVRNKKSPHMCLQLLDIDCGSPPYVALASYTLSSTKFRSTVEYACDEGHVQTGGNNSTTCLLSGGWTEVNLTCMEIDCGQPPIWVDLNVMVTSTSYNATATYMCREGYNIFGGSGISTCSGDSTWSTIDLTCIVVDCGFPPHQDGAVVDYTNTTYGSEANTFCIEGYSSQGNGTSWCLSDGTWSQTDLVCTEIDCGMPPTWVERNVTVTSSSYNSTATYICREGYDDYGGSRISTCTDNSTWSTIDLNCTIVDCGFPQYQDGSMVDYTSTTFSAEANYLCVKGYASSGNGTSMCLPNGTWSQTDLVCNASSHSTWQQVAITTAATTPIDQRDDLKNRISATCKPNLRVKTDFSTWSRVTDLHSNGVKSGVRIWGQSVRGLAKSSWDSFKTSPQRGFELFVSDALSTHMSVDDTGAATTSSYDGNFIWFVKDDQCMSTSHASDLGSVLTSLFEGGIGTSFDTYHVDGSNNSVYGQVSGHVSQSFLPTFKASPYWYISKKSTLGTSQVIRWKFAGAFVNMSPGSSSMTWCPDTCWHHVFDTRTSPTNKGKYIRHLINGVHYGHNIMLKAENLVAKAREIILHDGHVTVGVKEFWLPADKDAFSSGSLQAWMMASTTGRVVQCTHVPESVIVEDITENETASIWFLDSRQYDKALTIDGTGAVLSGSLSTLLIKVNEGRSLRVGVLHTNGLYRALEVDTVDVSSTDHIAVNIIHNADLVSGSGNSFSFSDTCRVVSSIITTEGTYKMYRYNIRSAGDHSTVNDVAKIDWFIEI
ncbi:uncharacterized protein LOC124264684 isoform X2 [Haliotis rubra]|uniref:uncharacterized protein LOC124264684 isoform X2 n=1 Tax=Haliotis rubra TaxID=36100 RepID=UPI001EE620D8|nr:uncharacterized protein LOC124264684 isoform X2 [Haliotis rubra]